MDAQPNDAHFGLAELQEHFDTTIITQNIDDLHERAGSKQVVHLHGEIFKMRSELDETLVYEIRSDIQLGDSYKILCHEFPALLIQAYIFPYVSEYAVRLV